MNPLIKAALLTTFVFITGIVFGLWAGSEKITGLEKTIIGLGENIDNAELQFLFFDTMGANVSCQYLTKETITLGSEANSLGSEVERFENSRKLDENSFKELKKKYTSVLIRDWLTLEKIKQTCKEDYLTVLYFYSNENCNDCKDQGIVLSYMKEKLGDKFLVFAIDSDIDLQIIDLLKNVYNVGEYPTLVLNNKRFSGFVDIESLKNASCEYNHNLEIC
jgi:thiol-disulfide isomerase/thioredoxin